MCRKISTVSAITAALLLTIALPRRHVIGSTALSPNEPDATTAPQRTEVNSLGSALGAPFRALGRLFGGGKKRKPVSKISNKDIKKFEGTEATRVNDANTPTTVAPTTEGTAAEHLQRGRDFLNAGQLNEAIAELTVAVSLDPKSGEANTLLGVAYDRKGLRERAQQSFETAVHAPEDQAMHLNNLGYLYYRHGEYDQAIKYLKRAAKVNPSDARVWNNLAMAQLAVERFDDAYKSLVHSVGEFESRMRIASNLEWSGYNKEAIKQLEKARAMQPNSSDVWAHLARLYDNTGQPEKADGARQSLNSLRTVANAPVQK
jgi:Flp pilus assembly protein TadD